MTADVAALIEQLQDSDARRETAKARQVAVWRGEEPDFLPLLCESSWQPWDGERFPLSEQVTDPDKMLYEALRVAVGQLPVRSDSLLCIRPQFGVGGLVTAFGVEYEVSTRYGSPWVVSQIPKERLARMGPDDIDFEGSLVARECRFLEHFKEHLDGQLAVYLPDTQGPFDIAHQARGHDIFTDMFDDPPFVHHLMELATHVYVEATRRLKAAAQEPLDSGHHTGSMYMEQCGARLCDDSSILLSPKLFEGFVLPYHQRALQPFGGGFVHWCGEGPQLLNGYLTLPEVRGINLGNPEMYEPAELFPRLLEAGKVCFGPWPRRPSESLQAYFDRLLQPLGGQKRMLILALGRSADMPPTDEIMSLWHEAQSREAS